MIVQACTAFIIYYNIYLFIQKKITQKELHTLALIDIIFATTPAHKQHTVCSVTTGWNVSGTSR